MPLQGVAQIAPSPDVYTHPHFNELAPLTADHVPGLPSYMPPPREFSMTQAEPFFQTADKTVTLTQGSPLAVWLLQPIDTQYLQVGDRIQTRVSNNLYVGVDTVMTEEDTLVGQVEELLPPTQGRNAVLKLRFTELHRDNHSEVVPINAVLKGHKNRLGGQLTPGTEEKVVVHNVMGIGRYNQSTLGGRRAMGRHLQLPVGEPLTLVLDSDVIFPVWVGPQVPSPRHLQPMYSAEPSAAEQSLFPTEQIPSTDLFVRGHF